MLKYTMSLRWLRWVLVALYLALILTLAGIVLPASSYLKAEANLLSR